MSDWSPEQYHSDPTVNALLNIAASLDKCGEGVQNLLYGLKFAKDEGMSIAEAIEIGAEKAAGSVAMAISNAFGEEHFGKSSFPQSAE